MLLGNYALYDVNMLVEVLSYYVYLLCWKVRMPSGLSLGRIVTCAWPFTPIDGGISPFSLESRVTELNIIRNTSDSSASVS